MNSNRRGADIAGEETRTAYHGATSEFVCTRCGLKDSGERRCLMCGRTYVRRLEGNTNDA